MQVLTLAIGHERREKKTDKLLSDIETSIFMNFFHYRVTPMNGYAYG